MASPSALEPSSAPSDNPSALSYSREDWIRGYQSQRQELEYWIDDLEGEVPPELTGTLFRNGPGQLDVGGQPFGHPFDGDGMICRFSFNRGRVHFSNRFVQTEGFLAEKAANRILYRGVFGTQKPGGWLANCFDLKAKNIANTGILPWGDRLLALWEGAEPHRLNPQNLDTIGIDRLDGLLGEGQTFSAHPRIDPGRDGGDRRLVNFSVKTGVSTDLTLYEFDESFQLLHQQTRTVPGFAFFHDFVLTPHYAIFFQNPVELNPLPFLLGLRTAGQCLKFRGDRPTRAIAIPRQDAAGEMKSFDIDASFVFHHANGFEDGNTLVVDSIRYDCFPSVDAGADFRDVDFDAIPAGELWRYRFNLETGQVDSEVIESRCCEFPDLHPDRVGRQNRYLYLGTAHAETGNAPLQALLKLDLETGDRQCYSFAPRGFGGEPIFAPRPDGTAEDDGWVLLLVYNAAAHRSELAVLDARNIDRGPIASLRLKQHIPYGLHGSFTEKTFV